MGSYNSTVYLDLRLSKGSADAVLASLGKQAEELGDKIDALKAKWANMTPQQIQDSGRQKEYDKDMKEIKRMLDDQRRLARAMQQDIKGLDLISKALEKNMKLTAQQSDQALREVRKRIKALGDDMSDEAQRELNMWKHIETELQNKSKSISAGFVSVFDEARKVIKTYRESSHEEMNKMAEDTEKHEQRVRDAAAKTMQAKKEASDADRKLNEATEKRQANAEKKQHAEQVIKEKKAQGVKLEKGDTVESLKKQVEAARKAKEETDRQMKAIAKNRGVEQKVEDAKRWQENMNREQRNKKSLEQAGAQPGVRVIPGGPTGQNAETPAEHQAANDRQVMSEQDKIKAEWQRLNDQEANWIKEKRKKQLSAIQEDYATATARRDELQKKLPAGYAQQFAQAKADKEKADRLIMAIAETRGTEYIDENGNKVKGRGVAVDAALRGVKSELQKYDTSKVEGEARVEMERKQAENAAEIARLRDIQKRMTSGSDYSLVERLDTDFEKARKAMLERAGELESLKALKESGSGNAALEDRINDVTKEMDERQKAIEDLTKKIAAAGATGEELANGTNPELDILQKASQAVFIRSKNPNATDKKKKEDKALLEKIRARIGQIQSGDLSGEMIDLKATDFLAGGDKMVERLAAIKQGRSNYAEQIRELQGKQAEQNAELVKLKAGEIVVADYEGMTPEQLEAKIAEAKAASDKAKSDFETIKKQRAAKGNKAGQDSIEARIRGLQAQNDVYDRRLSDEGRELTAEEKNKKRQLEERQAHLEEDQRLLQAEGIDTSKMVSNEDNERIRKRSKDAKELMEKNALTKKEQHELDTLLGQISDLEWALAHEGIQVQESRRARIEQTLKGFRDKKDKFLADHNLTEEQMLAMMGMAPAAPAAATVPAGSSAGKTSPTSTGAAPAAGTQYEYKTVKPETKTEKRRVKVGTRKVAAAGGTGSNALIEAYKGCEQQMTELNKKIEDNLAAQEEAMFADPDSLTALTEEQDKLGEQSQGIIAKMNEALAGLEAIGVKFSDDASKRYKVISYLAGVASGSAKEIEEDVFEEKDVLMYKDANSKWKEAKNGVVPDIKVKVPKAQADAPAAPEAPAAQAPIQASSATVQTTGDANVQAADDVNVGGEKPVSVEFKATPEEVAEALAEIQKDGETYLHGHGTGSTPGGVDPNEFFRTGLRVPHGDVSETTIPLSNEAGEISGKLSNWGHNDSKQVVIIPAKSAGVVFGPDGTRTPLDMFGNGSFQYKEEQVGTGLLAHTVSGYSPVYQNGQNAVWTKPEAPLGVYDSERGVFTASNINQYYEPYRGEDGKLHFRARGEQSVPSSSSASTASVSHLESVLKAVEGTREKGSIDEQVKWQELHVKALQHSKELDKSEEEYTQEQTELLDQYNAKRSAVIVSMSSDGLKGKAKDTMDAAIETMKEFGFGTENIGAGVAKQMQDKVNSLKQKMKETTDETEKGNIKKEVDRIEAAKKLLNGKIDEQLTPSDKWLKTRAGWIAELLKNSKTEQTDKDREKLDKEQDKLDELRDLVKEVNDITLGGIATDEQIAAVKKMVEDAKAEKAKQAEKPSPAPKKEEKKEEAPAAPAPVPEGSPSGNKVEKAAEQKKRGRKPKDDRTVEQKIIDDVNNGFELDAMKYVTEGEEMTEQSAVALSNSATATREQMLDLQGYTDRLGKAIDATKKALEIAENNIEMKKDADRRIAEAAANPSEASKAVNDAKERLDAAKEDAEKSGANRFKAIMQSTFGGATGVYEYSKGEELAGVSRDLRRMEHMSKPAAEQLEQNREALGAVKDAKQRIETAMLPYVGVLQSLDSGIGRLQDRILAEFVELRKYEQKDQEVQRLQEKIDAYEASARLEDKKKRLAKLKKDTPEYNKLVSEIEEIENAPHETIHQTFNAIIEQMRKQRDTFEKGSEQYNAIQHEIEEFAKGGKNAQTMQVSMRDMLERKKAERDMVMSEQEANVQKFNRDRMQAMYNGMVGERVVRTDEMNSSITRDVFMPQGADLNAFAKENGLDSDEKIRVGLQTAKDNYESFRSYYNQLLEEEIDIEGKSDDEIVEIVRKRTELIAAAKEQVDAARENVEKKFGELHKWNADMLALWRSEKGDTGMQISDEVAKRAGLDVVATNLANGSMKVAHSGYEQGKQGQSLSTTVTEFLNAKEGALAEDIKEGENYSVEKEQALREREHKLKEEEAERREQIEQQSVEYYEEENKRLQEILDKVKNDKLMAGSSKQQDLEWVLSLNKEQRAEFRAKLQAETDAQVEFTDALEDAVLASRGTTNSLMESIKRQREDNKRYDAIKNLQNEILGEEAASAARAGIAEAQSNWVGTNTRIANDFYYYGGQKSTIKRRYSAASGEEMRSNGSVTIDNAPVQYAEEYIHDNAADKGSQIRAFVDRIKSGVTSEKMPAWARQMTAEMSDNDKRTLIEALDTMTEKAVQYVQSLRTNADFSFEAQQKKAFDAYDEELARVEAAKAANPKSRARVRQQFKDAVTDEAIVAKVNHNLEQHLAKLSKDPKKFMEAFGFTEEFVKQLLESGMTTNNILQLKTAMADIISQPAATLVGEGVQGSGMPRQGKAFRVGADGKREQLPVEATETQGQVKLLPAEVLDEQKLDVFLQNLARGIIIEGNNVHGSQQGLSVGYDSETSATKNPYVIDAWNKFLRENGFVDYTRDRQHKPGDRTYIGQDYEGDKKTEEEWKQEAIARQQKFNDELFGYFTIFDKETKKEIGRFSRVWGDTGMSDYENWSQDRKDALMKQLRGTGYSIDKIGLKTTSAGKATDEQRHEFYRLAAERKANLQVTKEEDNWYMHSADKMENLEDRRERIEAHLNHLLELQKQLVAMPFENPKNSEEAQSNMEHLLNTFLRYKEEREAMNALRMARAEDPTQTTAHRSAEKRIKSAEAIKSDVDLIMEEDKTIKPDSSGQIKHTKAYLEALGRVNAASGQWRDYLTLRKEMDEDAKDIQKFEEENKSLTSNAQSVQRQAIPLFDYLRSLTTYETGETTKDGEHKLKKGLIERRIGSIKDHKDTTGVGKTNVQFGYSAFNAAIASMNTKIMQALNSADLEGNDELKDQLVKKLIDFKTTFQQKVEAIIGDSKGQGGMKDDRKLDAALKGLVSEMNAFETGITDEVKLNTKSVSTARYAEAKERKRTNEARIQSMESKLTEDKTMVALNRQKAQENVQTQVAQGGKTVGLASGEQMGTVLREIFDKLMDQIDHIDGMDPEFKKRFEDAVTGYLDSIAASDTADAVGVKGQIGNTSTNEQKAGAKIDELIRSRREQVMANNPTEETIKWATEIDDKQKQMLATEKEIQRLKKEGEQKNHQEILDLEEKKRLQEQELADLEDKLEYAQALAEGRTAKVNKGELEQKEQAAAETAAEKNETLKETAAAEQDARDEQDEFYRELGDRRVYRADRLKEMYQQMMAEIDSASLTPEEHKAMAQEIATIKQIYNELIGNIAADLERIGSIEGPVLDQMRKHFQEVINDVDAAPESIEAARKALASIAARDAEIATGGNRFSNDEVKDAINNLQEYIKTAKLTDDERQKFVADIAQGNLYLEEMSKKDAITQMNEQFKGLRPEATQAFQDLEKQAEDFEQQMENAKSEVEGLYNEIAKLEDEQISDNQKHADAAKSVTDSQARIDEAKKNLAIAEKEYADMTSLQNSKDTLERAEKVMDEIRNLEDQQISENSQREARAASISSAQEKISDAESRKADVQRQLDALEGVEDGEYKQRAKALLERTMDEIREEIGAQQDIIDDNDPIVRDFDARNKQLSNEIAERRELLVRMASSMQEFPGMEGKSIEEIVRVKKFLERTMDDLRHEIGEQQDIIDDNEQVVRGIDAKNEKLQAEAEKKRAEIEEKKAVRDEAEDSAKKLRDDMKKMVDDYKNIFVNNIANLSKDALQKQKEFWENEIRLGHEAAEGTMDYAERVKLLNAELLHRNDMYTAEEALDAAKNVGRAKFDAVKMRPSWRRGMFDKWTDNTSKEQKALQNRQSKLNKQKSQAEADGDLDAVDRIKQQIDEVEKKLAALKQNKTGVLVEPLKVSMKELLKIKKSLMEARKQFSDPVDDEGRKKLLELDHAIKDIDFDIKAAGTDMHNIPDIINRLQSTPLDELKQAAQQLKEQLDGMSENEDGRLEMVESYKEINAQISEMNEQLQEHKSQWDQAVSRLKTYVMVYMSFNKAMDLMKQVFNNTMQLSDQMTNVQKVTNLADDAVDKLTNSLMDLNTRTDLTNLMNLAEQGGKLGIALGGGEQALVSFVKAGEQIVNTLGEIGGAEAVTELLKVNDLVNKSSEALLKNGEAVRDMGINESLMRTGSAILNIGNNSKASYAKVSDFTRQMGAIGSAAKLSMPDIMALGGTIDALGGDISASATAVQKIIMGLRSNTQDVARAAGIGATQLREALDMGDTMGAFSKVLEGIKRNGSDISDVLKAMGGRQNVQAKTTLTLLVNNLDSLNYQLMLAKEGFEDGKLVSNEFEKANNNLAGTVEQIKNEFREMTSSAEGSHGAMLTLSQAVLSLVRAFNSIGGIGLAITAMLSHYIAATVASTVATYKHATAHKVLHKGETNILKIGAVFISYLWNKVGALLGVENAAIKATNAMNNLKRASAASWIGVVVSVVMTLVYALTHYESAAKKAAKRLQELTEAGEQEIATLTRLYGKLQNTNLEQERRSDLINQFNKQFGSYIGHLITETTQADLLASAYHKAAAAIKEKNAATIEEEASKQAYENHKDDYNKYSQSMMDDLLGSKYDKREAVTDVIAYVRYYMEQNANATVEDVMANVSKEFSNDARLNGVREVKVKAGKGYNTKFEYRNKLSDNYWKERNAFKEYLEDYIKELMEENEEYKDASVTADSLRKAAAKDKTASLQKLGTGIFATHTNDKGETVDDLTDEEKLLRLYDYMRDMKALAGTYTEEDEQADSTHKRGAINAEKASAYDSNFAELQKKIDPLVRSTSVWGKSAGNWDSMGGEELKEVIDWYEYIVKWITGRKKSDLVDVNAANDSTVTATRVREAFLDDPEHGKFLAEGIENWSVETIKQWAYQQATKARAIQEKNNNMNRNATFKWDSNKGSKHDPLEELMDKYLKRLEDFYNRQKDKIREQYEGQIEMEDVMNRELQLMDEKYYAARVGLEADFAGSQSTLSEARLNQFAEMTQREIDLINERKQTLLAAIRGEQEAELKASDFSGLTRGTLERTTKEKVVLAGTIKTDETSALRNQLAEMFNEDPTRVWDIATLKKQMIKVDEDGENKYKELAEFVQKLDKKNQQKLVDQLNKQRETLTVSGNKYAKGSKAQRDFVEMMKPLLEAEMQKQGIDAGYLSILLGQLSNESGNGTSTAAKHNNFGGLSSHTTTLKNERHYTVNGKQSRWLEFDSPQQYVEEYLKYLTRAYDAFGGTPADFVERIQGKNKDHRVYNPEDAGYDDAIRKYGRDIQAILDSATGEGSTVKALSDIEGDNNMNQGIKDILTVYDEKVEGEIEMVNERATELLQNAFIEMLQQNPVEKWDVTALKSAAKKQGGVVAEHISSLKDFQLKELVNRLAYLQNMSIDEAREELDKLNQRENTMFSIEDYGFGPEFDRDLQIIRGQLALGDPKHEKKLADLLANTSKDLLTYRKELAEHFKEIHKILLDGKPLEKAADDFRSAMTKLGLIFTDEELLMGKNTEREMARRLSVFRGYSAQIITMSEDEFTAQISQVEGFVGRTEEEYKVMYQQLLQFRDQYDEAARKKAKQELRMFENRYESGQWYEDQLKMYRKLEEASANSGNNMMTDAARRAMDYMSSRQNTKDERGNKVTYNERRKKEQEALETRVKQEEQIGSRGIANGVAKSVAEIKVANRQLKTAYEDLVAYKSLYNAQINVLQNQTNKETEILDQYRTQYGENSQEFMQQQVLVNELTIELQTARIKEEEVVKDKQEKVFEQQKALRDKEAALITQRINDYKEWFQIFQEMNLSMMSAGDSEAEAKNVELAELRAKKSLGLVQDTERQRFLIIKNARKDEADWYEEWLTEEERLEMEREIAAANARREALNKMMNDLGEKLSKTISDTINHQLELNRLKQEEEDKNRVVIDAQQQSLDQQFVAEQAYTAKLEQELERRKHAIAQMYKDARDLAENDGDFNGEMTVHNAGLDSNTTALGNLTNAISVLIETLGGDVAGLNTSSGSGNGTVSEDKPTDKVSLEVPEGMSRAQYKRENPEAFELDAVSLYEESRIAANERIMESDSQVASHQVSVTTDASKKSEKLVNKMASAMAQSMNLYGVTYAAVTNDNLSAQEKAAQAGLGAAGQVTNSLLSVLLEDTIAKAMAGEASGIAQAFGTNPWAAAAIIAVLTAAIGTAMGLAQTKIKGAQSKISSISGASSGKLTTGMLTYATGRYSNDLSGSVPGDTSSGYSSGRSYAVTGADGNSYSAKYEGAIHGTGIRKGTHFGIFSEVKPEMVIDGDTTALMHNKYPMLESAILQLHRTGSLNMPELLGLNYDAIGRTIDTLSRSGALSFPGMRMPAFAQGRYPYGDASFDASVASDYPEGIIAQQSAADDIASRDRLAAAIEALVQNGVSAHMSSREASKSLAKQQRFERRNGIKNGLYGSR